MGRAAKKRAERAREHAREVKAHADRKDALEWERIKNQRSGFAVEPQTKVERAYSDAEIKRKLAGRTHRELPRQTKGHHTGQSVSKILVRPDTPVAEIEARKEMERRKKQVGVLYNKGGYQYISPGMDLKTLGKK